jgi:Holliday junction resolvase RusA-like endonuclease
MIRFHVPGVPVPKVAIKTMVRNGIVLHFKDTRMQKWEDTVTRYAILERAKLGNPPPIEGPVILTCAFYFEAPKSSKQKELIRPKITRPDFDNLMKAICDALTKADIWTDDSVVFKPGAESGKFTTTQKEILGVEIQIEER